MIDQDDIHKETGALKRAKFQVKSSQELQLWERRRAEEEVVVGVKSSHYTLSAPIISAKNAKNVDIEPWRTLQQRHFLTGPSDA